MIEYRPLTEHEQAMHIERFYRARNGLDFNYATADPLEQRAIFNTLWGAEQRLVAPHNSSEDYGDGTAEMPDEIRTDTHGSSVLLSSEHATRSWSVDYDTGDKTPKPYEAGTAALGSVIAAETYGTHIAMVGRQTGNANFDQYHPYKRHLQHLIGAGAMGAFVSLHGMRTGLVSDLSDERPYDMLLGVGNNPNASTLEAAAIVLRIAESLGLRAGINKPFLEIVGRGGRYWQKMYSDGTPVTNVFSAPEYTTRAAAQRIAHQIGLNLPTLQVELAGSIRVLSKEVGAPSDANLIGPYLAYNALRAAVSMITRSRTVNVA